MEKVTALESDLNEVFANLAVARREQAQEHQAYEALQDQLEQRDTRLQAYAEDFRTRERIFAESPLESRRAGAFGKALE